MDIVTQLPRKVREITLVSKNDMVVWNDMDLTEPVRIYHKSVAVSREASYTDSFGAFRMQVRNGDVVTLHGLHPKFVTHPQVECQFRGEFPVVLNITTPVAIPDVAAVQIAQPSTGRYTQQEIS